MEYYPAAARAAGIEGWANVKCPSPDASCVVVSEHPAGAGFGQSAVIITKRWARMRQSIERPASAPHDPQPSTYHFAFSLHPPAILPNPLRAILITNPDWEKRPGGWQMIWPVAAYRAHISGDVVLNCYVTQDGRLNPCAVTEESPQGWGFGEAALSMASTFRMKPMLMDGRPVGGARMRLPLQWRPN